MGIEMQTTALTQVIAKKVFMKSAKVPEELQKSSEISQNLDSVDFSTVSTKISNSTQNLTEFEKQRAVNLERIKDQVNSGSYSMDSQVIEQLAEKIANMLM